MKDENVTTTNWSYLERMDKVMIKLYGLKHDGFARIGQINPGYFGDNEVELYVKQFEKEGYVESRVNETGIYEARLNFDGIRFCESSSYADPKKPLIPQPF